MPPKITNNANYQSIFLDIMKKTLVMAVAIVAALSMTSCRSSKTLTEATVAAPTTTTVEEVREVAPITYTTPKRTTPVAQAGDRQEKVTVVNSGDAALLKDYNVVVGAFGSKTNAENFKNKMRSRGYNSFLVQNASGLYRVVAGGYDTREQAVSVRDNIRTTYANDDPGTCPAAWLLIPSL